MVITTYQLKLYSLGPGHIKFINNKKEFINNKIYQQQKRIF